jgi:hypothetical protein
MTSFGEEKSRQFVAVCKANHAKVNGVLTMILILAWRLVYKRLEEASVSEIRSANKKRDLFEMSSCGVVDKKINYATDVNLRPFVKDVDPSSLSFFCNKLYSTFDEPLDLSQSDFWRSTFWSLARRESDMFHARLKGQYMLFIICYSSTSTMGILKKIGGEQFRLLETLEPLDIDESRIHFGLSNVLLPSNRSRLSSFKISEIFIFTSYPSEW